MQEAAARLPQGPDGHDRMAMLRMAEGQSEEAARHCGKLLEMVQKNPQHFDPETVQEGQPGQGIALRSPGHVAGSAPPALLLSASTKQWR